MKGGENGCLLFETRPWDVLGLLSQPARVIMRRTQKSRKLSAWVIELVVTLPRSVAIVDKLLGYIPLFPKIGRAIALPILIFYDKMRVNYGKEE